MRIVLAGATGFLGRPLLERLAAEGHDLVVLTRSPRGLQPAQQVQWLPDGRAGPWAAAVDGAQAVVNLAGAPIFGAPILGLPIGGRWNPSRKLAIHQSRVLSTRSLVAALDRAGSRPGLLINGSGVDYYGSRGDEIVTETDSPGQDFLARVVRDWEDAALAAEGGGTRVVLLRTGLVLARGGGALEAMLVPFKLGVGGPVGSGKQYWPWIHRTDWVALVSHLLQHPSASGPINATAPNPVTNEVFSRTLARVLHRPALLRMPAFALRLMMGETADARVITGQRAIPARAQELGFQFTYPELEPALRNVLG